MKRMMACCVCLMCLVGCEESRITETRATIRPIAIQKVGNVVDRSFIYVVQGCDPQRIVTVLEELKYDCHVGSVPCFEVEEPCFTIDFVPLFGEYATIEPDGSVLIRRIRDDNDHRRNDEQAMLAMQRLFFH